MEPRKLCVVGVVLVELKSDSTPGAVVAWRREPDRGQRARHRSTRVPTGTWEALSSPPKRAPAWVPADRKIPARGGGCPRPAGAKRAGTQAVTEGKGN